MRRCCALLTLFAVSSTTVAACGPSAPVETNAAVETDDPIVATDPPSPQNSQQAPTGVPAVFLVEANSLPVADRTTWDALVRAMAEGRTSDAIPPDAGRTLAAAELAYRQHDYRTALESLVTALRRWPELPPATLLAATTYFRLHRYGDAVDLFERFLKHAPDDVWRTQAMGHSLLELGRHAEAADHYARVLELRPESVGALRGLALVSELEGEAKRAIELLSNAMELAPDDAAVCEALAAVYWEEFEPERARDLALRAIELAPERPKAWLILSRAEEDLGQAREADRARARFDELDKLAQEERALVSRLPFEFENPSVWLRLGQVRAAMGSVQSSLDALRTAVERSHGSQRADAYDSACRSLAWTQSAAFATLCREFKAEFPEDERARVWEVRSGDSSSQK